MDQEVMDDDVLDDEVSRRRSSPCEAKHSWRCSSLRLYECFARSCDHLALVNSTAPSPAGIAAVPMFESEATRRPAASLHADSSVKQGSRRQRGATPRADSRVSRWSQPSPTRPLPPAR